MGPAKQCIMLVVACFFILSDESAIHDINSFIPATQTQGFHHQQYLKKPGTAFRWLPTVLN
jgi:hypothetical protein